MGALPPLTSPASARFLPSGNARAAQAPAVESSLLISAGCSHSVEAHATSSGLRRGWRLVEDVEDDHVLPPSSGSELQTPFPCLPRVRVPTTLPDLYPAGLSREHSPDEHVSPGLRPRTAGISMGVRPCPAA